MLCNNIKKVTFKTENALNVTFYMLLEWGEKNEKRNIKVIKIGGYYPSSKMSRLELF